MNSLPMLAGLALFTTLPSLALQNPPDPFQCERTCTADPYFTITDTEWSISFTAADGSGTSTCDTCKNCKGLLTYVYTPSDSETEWELTTDHGDGLPPTSQGGTGMTSGSIRLHSSCDDINPGNVTGTQGGQGAPGFEAFLYCQC